MSRLNRLSTFATELAQRVIGQPLRLGLAGWRQPPPGYRSVLLLGLLSCACYLLLLIVLSVLPGGVPLSVTRSSLSVPGTGSLLLFGAVLALSLAITSAIHAPWWLSLLTWLAAGCALITLVSMGTAQWPSVGAWLSPLVWLLLGVLIRLRRRTMPAWWEFWLVTALIWLAAWGPGLLTATVNRALGAPDAANAYLLVLLFGVAALPFALLTGAALAGVAASFCLWLVELLRRERTGGALLRSRGLGLFTAVLAVLIAGWSLVTVVGRSLGPVDLALTSVTGVALTALCLLGWKLLDLLADRRDPGSTQVHQLTARVATAAWPAAVLFALPHALSVAPLTILTTLRVAWAEVPGAATGDRLLLALSNNGGTVDLAATAAVGLLCVVIAVRHALRGNRGAAELLGIVGLVQLLRLIAGWLELGSTAAVVGLSVLLLAGILAVRALLRGTLTGPVGEAIAVAVLLAGALTNLELVADPVGTLLETAGGPLVVLALVWTALTAGDPTVGDSRAFPRISRVLLVLAGLLVSVLTAVGAVTLPRAGAQTVEGFIGAGAQLLGVPLLLCVAIAVLDGARQGREPREVGPSAGPPRTSPAAERQPPQTG